MSIDVSVATAADVLGWTRPKVYAQLQLGLVPWGTAAKAKGRSNYTHTIYSALLAEYCGLDEDEIVRRELEHRARFKRGRGNGDGRL